jgi:rare lipoprotein A
MQRHAKQMVACVSAAAVAMLVAEAAFAESAAPSGTGAEAIVGAASFYDISGETASGEQYDPKAFTAAAQFAIRDRFGGIKFGSLYRVAFAIAEYAGKKLILKVNDVGPLRPGRKFDLSRAAMEYFGGVERGVLPDLKVTVLPVGQAFAPGPVSDEQLAALGFGNVNLSLASADSRDARAFSAEQGAIEPRSAPMETPSATAVPIDACVDLARVCEEPSTAVARIEPPAASRDRASADVQVTGVIRPIVEIDRWQAIAMWLAAGDRHEDGRENTCSFDGC